MSGLAVIARIEVGSVEEVEPIEAGHKAGLALILLDQSVVIAVVEEVAYFLVEV